MIEILYFIPIVLVCFALGKKIFSVFNVSFESFLEESIFSIGFGFGIIAYLTLGLGLLGLLYSRLFYFLFATLFIIFFKEIRLFLKKFYFSYKNFPKLKLSLNSILIVIIFTFIILNLLATMAPPWSFDALGYHMAVPKLYVTKHSIYYIPHIINSNVPFTIEMLYTVGLLLKNGVLSKLFTFSFGVLLLLATFSFSRRYFSKRIALFSALIFYTLPVVMENVTIANVDIGFAFFAFLAFYSLVNWFEKSINSWLTACAIFTGLAAGTKLPGLYYALFLVIAVLYKLTFVDNFIFSNILKKAVLFGSVVFFTALPWYLKSFIWTGNPVWPLVYPIFGGKYLTAELAKSYTDQIMSHGMKRDFLNFLLLPWNLTMNETLFAGFMGIGPIFLSFIPLLVCFKKIRPLIKYMLLYALALFVGWFFGVQVIRHLFLVWALLAVVAAYSVNILLKTRIKFFVLLVLTFTLAYNSALWYGINSKQLPVALGLESREQFYTKLKDKNAYVQFQWINTNIPKNSKIFFFREVRGYFSDVDYIWGNPEVQAYVNYSGMQTWEELYSRLKEIGITHIMMNTRLFGDEYLKEKGKYSYCNHAFNLMDELIKNNSTLIYEKDGIFLYTFN